MKIKNQIIISFVLSALIILIGTSSVSAVVSPEQNLNGPTLATGLTGSVTNCSPLTVSNGSVAAYPTCTITCNSGYTLSGSACNAAGGGGGGGGGSATPACTSVTYSDWSASCFGNLQTRSVVSTSPSTCTLTSAQQTAAQRNCQAATPAEPATPATPTETPATPATPAVPANTVLAEIASEAVILNTKDTNQLLGHLGNSENLSGEQNGLTKYKTILGLDKKISADEKATINDFIVYGTRGTQRLGAGERGAVVNSYFQAYGKLPNTEAEWSDVLKIGSGRWPSERSTTAEAQAKVEFKKVYARSAVMTNNIDENAIMVIAYGLLPLQRNLNSEKVAIKTFRWVYAHDPVNALAWNIVRSIAYSGAKR
ncbi:MAG: hypothetical protein WCT50_04095 [Patescibacteria group bacterium]|jgi:hypothetical protein